MEKQIKSKKRVADHGEVFTAEREVNAMLDLVSDECNQLESRFLEPACGDGNFLVEILRRKLAAAKRLATPRGRKNPFPYDYELKAVAAITSIYGVDLMMDNVIACRNRLFDIWDKEYKKICKKETNEQTREAVRFILSRNIVCGNALTLMCVDEKGFDTQEPIVFSQWSFMNTSGRIKREDFTFDEILNGKPTQKKPFHDEQIMFDIMDEPEPDPEGKFLAQYITHYRRLGEDDIV